MPDFKFKATKVFHECWSAINETIVDEKGKTRRKYRLIEQVGGSRSSKTWSDFQILFLYSAHNRRKRITIMRDTAADCRDKVEPDWKDWLSDPNGRIKQYEEGEITIEELDAFLSSESLTRFFINNKSDHSWTFIETGSIITFTGTDDADRSIGKSQSVLWVNEPYKFNEEVFKQLSQRTTDFIIVDWNPKQGHFIEKQRLKPNTFTHRSTLLDNPFCPEEQRKQILSYQPLKRASTVQSKRITETQAYEYNFTDNPLNFTQKEIKELIRCIDNELQKTASDYHYLVYMKGEKAERPNRIFTWTKISTKEYNEIDAKKYVGNDWGKVDPWGILEAKYTDNRLYLRQLNYASENQIRATLNQKEIIEVQEIEKESRDKEETGIVVKYFGRLDISHKTPIICDTNRPKKIAALRRMGYTAFPAPSKNIMDGIDLLDNLEVFYTECSPDLENEQENYSWIVDKYGHVTEEAEDDNNHLIDPARYIALYLQSIGVIKAV